LTVEQILDLDSRNELTSGGIRDLAKRVVEEQSTKHEAQSTAVRSEMALKHEDSHHPGTGLISGHFIALPHSFLKTFA